MHADTPDQATDSNQRLERDVRRLSQGLRELAARTAPDYQNVLSIVVQELESTLDAKPVDSLLPHLRSELQREVSERAQTEKRLHALAEVSREFSSSTSDVGELLDVVTRRLGELLGDMCAIRATSDDGEWLEATGAVYHADPALLAACRDLMQSGRQRIGEGISGGVAKTGRAVLASQISADYAAGGAPHYLRFLQQLGASSAITLPLRYRGKVVGVANLLRGQGSVPYDERDLAFAESLADHAAVAIANARATSAVRKAESRFARLSESGVIGIVVSDIDGHIAEINDSLLALLGHSRADIVSGKVPWRDLTPPEWRDVDTRAIALLLESGIGGEREKEFIRKDGTRVSVVINSAMLGGDSRECISYVLDLTARKEAEAAVAQLRAQRVADLRFRALLESAPDAMVIADEQGAIVLVNRQVEALFGYAREELIGKPVEMLMPERLRTAARHADYFRELGVRSMGGDLQLHGQRRDGGEFVIEVSSSPLQTDSGLLISSAIRDITERKQAEFALLCAKDAAESASRELEAFSYSVAHDLRAPLRGMNGFAQILLDDYRDELDEEGIDCLFEIHSNAKKMGELIDALLSLSRTSRTELRPEAVDLSELVRSVGAELAANAPERDVSLVVQEQLHLSMDPALTRVLFDNLLGNAWKFTAHVPKARIEVGTILKDGLLSVFVKDNGAGFEMAHAQKLFAPFQRLHTVAEFPGTGIGLATAQRIAHRHGGRLSAEGHVGEGAVFYLGLPSSCWGTP